MGCLQSSDMPKASHLHHVKTESGAVYIANDEPLVNWEFLEDINHAIWTPYSRRISKQINVAFNTQSKKCQFADKASGQSYEIDFHLMLETNVVTGWQRKVRIQPQQMIYQQSQSSIMLQQQSMSPQQQQQHTQQQYNNHQNHISMASMSGIQHQAQKLPQKQNKNNRNSAEPKQDINPLLLEEEQPRYKQQQYPSAQDNGIQYKWQWHSESIGWKDYDDKLSNKINEAYLSNVSRYAFKIRSNNTKYQIDFVSMKQCNLDTHKLRTIRRVPVDENGDADDHEMDINEDNEDEDVQQQQVMNVADVDDMGNHEGLVWEYFDETDNEWHEYDDNVSLKIESVYQSDAVVARMKIGGIEYEIRLNELPMNQCNLKTGKISQIRRMIVDKTRRDHHGGHIKRPSKMKNSMNFANIQQIHPSQPALPSNSNNNNNNKYVWKYKQGFNLWKSYPFDLNTKIENAFRCEMDRYQFTLNNEAYEIQFNYLRQINLNTNEMNEIARIDNTLKARTQSAFVGNNGLKNNYIFNPIRDLNQNQNQNQKQLPAQNNLNNPQHVGHHSQPKNRRSHTVDMAAPNNDFEKLVKQQSKALTYFNKQHSKKNSLLSEVGVGIAAESQNEDYKMNKAGSGYQWRWKNDDNEWIAYSSNISSLIEQAYQSGDDTVEITKSGVIYEIRLEHNLECHFATNKMREIERIGAIPSKSGKQIQANYDREVVPAPQQNVYDDDFADEFDALSNNLEAFEPDQHHSARSKPKPRGFSSDYDDHDEDEKDIEYHHHQQQTPMTPQYPSQSQQDDDDDEEDTESDDDDEEESDSEEDSESDDDDVDEDEDEEEEEEQRMNRKIEDGTEMQSETPADSEFAANEYGNDYNAYIQRFNNLNSGYFD